MIAALLGAAALAGGYVDPAQVTWANPKKYARLALQYYPRDAQRRLITGAVLVDCLLSAEGALQDCRPVVETPLGHGFGKAAVQMTILLEARSVLKNGDPLPAAARIKLPVYFHLPGRPAPPLPLSGPASGKAQERAIAALGG